MPSIFNTDFLCSTREPHAPVQVPGRPRGSPACTITHHHDLRGLDAARSWLSVAALVIAAGAVILLVSKASMSGRLIFQVFVFCPIAYIFFLFWTLRRMNRHEFSIALNSEADPPTLHVQYRRGEPSIYPRDECRLLRLDIKQRRITDGRYHHGLALCPADDPPLLVAIGDEKLVEQTEAAFVEQFGLPPARDEVQLQANFAGMIDLMKIPAQTCP